MPISQQASHLLVFREFLLLGSKGIKGTQGSRSDGPKGDKGEKGMVQTKSMLDI